MYANDKELMPHNEQGHRHGFWLIQPKRYSTINPSVGYTAYFVNGELHGYSEEIDIDYVVINKEYYAT